jgi:eukaryotic-like serine/threonine-protein kinase
VGSSSKRSNFWRTDWFVGVLVVLVLYVLHQTTDVVETLENRFYDFGIAQANKKPSDQIAVIAIDDLSVANVGRWPWSRDIQAQLIEKISEGKPKAIINGIFYPEAQIEKGLPFLRKIRQTIKERTSSGDLTLEAVDKIAQEGELALNADERLARAFASAGNVTGLVTFSSGEIRGKPDKPLRDVTLKSLIRSPSGFGAPYASILEPIDLLGSKIELVGHGNKPSDVDGTTRTESLLIDYYDQMVPSMALVAAIKGLNLTTSDVVVRPDDRVVQIGKLRIGTDEKARMRPFYYADRDNKIPFSYDSAFDVITGKIPASKYAGKVVLLGPTAAGVGVEFPTPLGRRGMTPLEQTAHVTSSILSEHFVTTPWWAEAIATLTVLLVAGYLIGILPRLSAGSSALVTGTTFALLLLSSHIFLSRFSYWLQFMLPVFMLLMGHLALTTKRFLWTEAGKIKSDAASAEANREVGMSEQNAGQLDRAFDFYRRIPFSDALMANLSNLALDFERKRQFNKAQAVYEHMAGLDKTHKGLHAKLTRAKNLSETVILGGSGSHPGGTMLLDGGEVEKPMLGRYQVDKELGKGAMGVVYLGKDPKIGRVVAIKTMALSQEFDGDDLVDARERFFREAKTAGKLQHQNIVTIFDAGEEHDLAYIAMEFLKGRDLVDSCKEGALLPIPKVLSIVERVAQALAYAHRQNVVHRDIKPANIMYDLASDTVKVTDFGIARITDSSKTKTGMVLGTPSFMSPEQIAGKKIDGRSDLYSLGVMLYQMLAGVLPFRGDSMAELMYKISNEEASDIRMVRQELSEQLAQMVARALSKRPEARYQDGDALAADLRLSIADLGDGAGASNHSDLTISVKNAEKTTDSHYSQNKTQIPSLSLSTNSEPSPLGEAQKNSLDLSNFNKTVVSSLPNVGAGT